MNKRLLKWISIMTFMLSMLFSMNAAAKTITSVTVTDLERPVIGAALDETFKYTKTSETKVFNNRPDGKGTWWLEYNTAADQKNDRNGTVLASGASFKKNKYYTFVTTFRPNTGNSFGPTMYKVTINGVKASGYQVHYVSHGNDTEQKKYEDAGCQIHTEDADDWVVNTFLTVYYDFPKLTTAASASNTSANAGKTSIAKAKVTVASATFTGAKQTPKVTVTLDGKKLKSGTDYTVAYSSNVNAGSKAKVTVTGTGDYAGTVSQTFTIAKAPITKAEVELEKNTYTYTGSAIKPKFTVILGKYAVTSKDYTVSYSNNKAVGTASLTLKGKRNLSGSVKVTFKIVKEKKTQPAKTSFSTISTTYKNIDKTYKIKLTGVKEKAAVTYATSNKKVATVSKGTIKITGSGLATITVKLAETNNYKQAEYKIKITVVAKPEITANDADCTYEYGSEDASFTCSTSGTGALTYSSSDTSVVKINSKTGKLSFDGTSKVGAVNIVVKSAAVKSTSKAAGFTAETVSFPITITKAKQVISGADTKTWNIQDGSFNLELSTIVGGALTYESSAPGILTVEEDGTCTPYAWTDGATSKSVTVTVNAAETALHQAATKTVTITLQADSNYALKVQSFITTAEGGIFRNGMLWNDETKQVGSVTESVGDRAYVNSFIYYMYGKNDVRDGYTFTVPEAIKDGDIITLSDNHQVVVLKRYADGRLLTAEGGVGTNPNQYVRVSNAMYYLENGVLKSNADNTTFSYGVHFDTANVRS